MLARCGRAAHICEANKIGLKIANKNLRENRNCHQNQKVAMRTQGFRGNCDSQGKLGMCPSLAEPDASGFPKKNLLLGKRSFASGKNRSALLPLCGSPVAALSELSMNRSPIPVFWNYFCFLEWRTAVSSCSSIFLFSHQYVC